ncbi:cobalamin biosynthesis protein [Tepiditoga spiralis]|uniref:Cobalamin biosynthesis protein CobD n=1 Tax=Tepiditoga spiralis TaxID=2108365 RepID=A0A7G1G358_9BACT|nr:adenosylcobinamide-phosphate synthase CbiB [Tepiditoga spiralis]BBE30820.1 cobalamin biosynthesis protein [Tepiditoga spiralis]
MISFIAAIFLDILFGEPKPFFHPVVWCGTLTNFIDKKLKHNILNGVLLVSIVLIFSQLLVYFVNILPLIFSIILSIFFIKSSFSISSLYEHVKKCDTDDIKKLKHSVSMIVSRDTSSLKKEELYSAAIETLAENFVDGVVSPFFYYLLFGLNGIIFQRFSNTMDAMIGYHNEKYEKFGKFAARLDDVLNYIPARLSIFFFFLFNPKGVLNSVKKYGGIKLNGTWSMAAMAGLLNIKLEKKGFYSINPNKNFPNRLDLKKALTYYIFISLIIILMEVLLLCTTLKMLNMEEMFHFRGLIFQYL